MLPRTRAILPALYVLNFTVRSLSPVAINQHEDPSITLQLSLKYPFLSPTSVPEIIWGSHKGTFKLNSKAITTLAEMRHELRVIPKFRMTRKKLTEFIGHKMRAYLPMEMNWRDKQGWKKREMISRRDSSTEGTSAVGEGQIYLWTSKGKMMRTLQKHKRLPFLWLTHKMDLHLLLLFPQKEKAISRKLSFIS